MAAELTLEKRFNVKLDIKRSASNREFEVVEGDTGNVIDIVLTDDGSCVDMTGYRVMAVFSKSDGTSCQDSENGTVLIEGNRATIPLFPSSFSPGMVECELQIYSGQNGDTLVTSAKFNFKCRRGILNQDTIPSTGELPILIQLVDEVERLSETVTMAEGMREAAENLRRSGEIERINNEAVRQSNEASRLAAEIVRENNEQMRQISVEEALAAIESAIGDAARRIEFTTEGSVILWRYTGDEDWQTLIDLSEHNLSVGAVQNAGEALRSGIYTCEGGILAVGRTERVSGGVNVSELTQFLVPHGQDSPAYRTGESQGLGAVSWSDWGKLLALNLPSAPADEAALTGYSKAQCDMRFAAAAFREVSGGSAASIADAQAGSPLQSLRLQGYSYIQTSGGKYQTPDNIGELITSTPSRIIVSSNGTDLEYSLPAPVALNGIGDDVRDEYDVLTGLRIRHTVAVALRGAETGWMYVGGAFVLPMSGYKGDSGKLSLLCTHYRHMSWAELSALIQSGSITAAAFDSNSYLRIADSVNFSGQGDLAAFKSYLGQQYSMGTPVKILVQMNSYVSTPGIGVNPGAMPDSPFITTDSAAYIAVRYMRDIAKALAAIETALTAGGKAPLR